jgi:NitT/TauT family transport system permease protein
MRRWIHGVLFFIAILLIWQWAYSAAIWSKVLLPSPGDVLQYLITSSEDGTLWLATMVTLRRLFLGYFSGILIGIPIGLLNSRFEFLEDTIGLLALGLQTLPSICWAPLAILWFGQTEKAMFFIVVMGSIWSIVIATTSGVKNVPSIYVKAAKTMGSKNIHTWFKVILPAAFPYIVTGMKQSWAFAWRSLMAAEIYITVLTGFGLGNLLHYSRELQAMDAVIAIIFVIVTIGLLVDKIFFSPIETYLHERWGTGESQSSKDRMLM